MRKVMIVDDNYLSAQGIAQNIDWEALQAVVVHIKSTGSSAIEAMREQPVDLIISDIKMPDLDGISMSKLALSVNPHVKIILISAYDKFEYAKRAIRLGVFDYIEKPINYSYMTEKIQGAFLTIEKEQRNIELLNQSRPLMKEKFFRELLHSQGADLKSHLSLYAQYLNLDFDYPYLNVIIIEIENASELEAKIGITAYQLELLNFTDLFREKCAIFSQCYLINEFNSIHCVLAQKSSSPDHFLWGVHKVVSSIVEDDKDSSLYLNFGIGHVTSSVWNLHLSYESALHALKYRFFFPNKHIFDAKEGFGQEFTLLSSTETQEDALIRLLCQKDSAAIEIWLHDFFLELSQKYPAKNLMFIQIYSLLGRILKFLYELNIDTADIEAEITAVYNKFDIFHTYEQFFEWMNQLCLLVCKKLDTSLKTYHDQIVALVLSYIRENFENNALCLTDIARHANVSPAYLSALFKKVYGHSISDTITSCRIDQACQYLTRSNLSLKEISRRCGYANQYYFSNSFKKKLGVSPSGYRERMSEIG